MERDASERPDDCDLAFEMMSARLDGELSRSESDALADHLGGCPTCTALSVRLDETNRRLRVRPTEPVPDLVDAIVTRSRPVPAGVTWMRPMLAWVAVVLIVQNAVALAGGVLDGADEHTARHVGAFGVSLGIGFLYAAWRPHRAHGLLPFAGALAVTMATNAVLDVASGGRDAVAEAVHVAEVIGVILLWGIAGRPGLSFFTQRRSVRHSMP
ncbi:MAG: zf-HC2 domain-containing protein [Actinomycetota bacterium]